MDIETLLPLDRSAQGPMVKESKIPYTDSGSRLFAALTFEKVKVLGLYYGSQVYASLTRKRHGTKTRVQRVMPVTVETFRKWANKLPQKVTDKHGFDHKVCIVPVSFCAILVTSDERCFLGVTRLNIERWKNLRQNNFKVLHRKSPSSPTEYSGFRIFGTQALRNISVRKELRIYHGNKYHFSNRG